MSSSETENATGSPRDSRARKSRDLLILVLLATVSFLRAIPTTTLPKAAEDIIPEAPLEPTFETPIQPPVSRSRDELSPSMRSLPNLFIAGAQKGGTSTIHTRLSPLVCEPKVFPEDKVLLDDGLILRQKEVHFFDDGRRYHSGVDFYRARYSNCTKFYAVDSTPDYLPLPQRIREFYEQHGNASELKIILSLREPVAREISMYHNMVRQRFALRAWASPVLGKNDTVRTFEEYVRQYLFQRKNFHNSYGNYARWIPGWLDNFDRSQILIVAYDELKRNSTSFWNRIETFLDVKIPPAESTGVVNPSRPSDPVSCELQQELSTRYQASTEQLYKLLEQNPGPSMEQRPFPRFRQPC